MDSDVHVMGNCSTVECLTYNFIKRLRKAKPQTPVLLIEGEKRLGLHWIAAERHSIQNNKFWALSVENHKRLQSVFEY